MRHYILYSLLLLAVSCNEQKKPAGQPAEKDGSVVTLSSFTRAEDYRLVDTINAAMLPQYLGTQRPLSHDSATALIKLLDAIKDNGTDDVSKCFIPRHVINFKANDSIQRFVLVCFECEGIRFSGEKTTPVINEEKRITQMNELKKYFAIQ